MKFNYSYKAFLFATLIVGNLLLVMILIKIGGFNKEIETQYEIEYLEQKDTKPAAKTSTKVAVNTHKAYNEAEKFITQTQVENQNFEQEYKKRFTNTQLENDQVTQANNKALLKSQEALKNVLKNKKSQEIKTSLKKENIAGNTTIKYRLVNRRALLLPNPVYTCDASGKVVINITVNTGGNVTQATVNKSASTTTNECLFDSAITYAFKARFNTDNSKETQLGTITYIFPGQ
jgi:TonB family protein